MSHPPRRLTVVSLDIRKTLKFPGPYGTVTFHIDPLDASLRIFAEPETNALDWDVATALMGRVSDPRRKLPAVPSLLRKCQFWEVQLVDLAGEYLLLTV